MVTPRHATRRILAPLCAALALAGCAGTRVVDHPSPNQDARVRILVMHFTDEDFRTSLHTLTDADSKRRVSAHYLVSAPGDPSRAPRVYRLVDESRRAWHAGDSRWQGRQAVNDQSIGIEIVYEPSCPASHALPPGAADPSGTLSAAPPAPAAREALDPCTYPDYPPAQIARVARLARGILARHPDIDPTRVVGHADVAPSRKADPGPRFPWRALHEAGIGAWYDEADVAAYRGMLAQVQPPIEALMREALEAYGYGIADAPDPQARLRDAIFAFQTHFLPEHRTGVSDAESAAVALALLRKYRPEALAPVAVRFGF